VIATADVRLQQVQVIDKNGQSRSLVVWQCGPDVVYGDSLQGLFDATQRRKAPEWLVEQLAALSPDRQFDFQGKPKSARKEHVPSEVDDDDDVPDFAQL
jgi:hypothetical protein